MRRMGERGVREGQEGQEDNVRSRWRVTGLAVLPNALVMGRRVFRAREEEPQPGVEMGSAELRVGEQAERPSQREWARQRALAMLGRNRSVEEERTEDGTRQIPRWRRVVEQIWPGLS